MDTLLIKKSLTTSDGGTIENSVAIIGGYTHETLNKQLNVYLTVFRNEAAIGVFEPVNQTSFANPVSFVLTEEENNNMSFEIVKKKVNEAASKMFQNPEDIELFAVNK